MNALFRWILGLVPIGVLIALNAWAFPRWLGTSYFEWYLANGALINLLTSLIALSWGDLNRHVGLIAARPLDYAGSALQLVGLPLVEIGTLLEGKAADSRRRNPIDLLLTDAVLLLVVVALVGWLLVVAPMQYFVVLVCGAPGRVFAAAGRRVAARLTSDNRLETRVLPAGEEPGRDWWLSGIAGRPVAATGLLASLLFVALNKLL